MSLHLLLSKAFQYPAPGRLECLQDLALELQPGPGKNAFVSFLSQISARSLGEWEELYTRTFDLNPLAAPYIGFHIWGEDYRRGSFLAHLQQEYRQHTIEMGSELPDHLSLVLGYLGRVGQPSNELAEVYEKAVERMTASLRRREPGSPYLHLLEAVSAAGLPSPEGGASEPSGCRSS